ncbi:MAG TPA: MFS transporter [Pirellulales bacterium]
MPTTETSDAAGAAPTRVRYRVVSLAVLLAMLTYLDRACIAKLAPYIMEELALSKDQMSYVFSSFALAYAIFEIPTAAWADRVGTRRVLVRIVAWWSAFTMLTAAAFNCVSMVAIRFLFGAGEAGAWPSVARTFAQWIPRRERGTIQGIFFAGAHLSGGLTPLVVVFFIDVVHWHWRTVFVAFGALGLVWAWAWQRRYRDDPTQHPGVNAAELALIVAGRDPAAGHGGSWNFWRRVLTHRNVIALSLMYLPNSFVFYFCITWLPTFLHEKHGLSAGSLGIFAGLPLILSVLADLFGGLTTDWAVARFGLRPGRVGVGCLAYLVAAATMFSATLAVEPRVAATLLALATASSMFILGAAWGTCIDIGGNHAGVVSAVMNTSGQIGSILCPIVVTSLARRYNDWNAPLYLIAALFLSGAVAWCFVDPRRKVFN